MFKVLHLHLSGQWPKTSISTLLALISIVEFVRDWLAKVAGFAFGEFHKSLWLLYTNDIFTEEIAFPRWQYKCQLLTAIMSVKPIDATLGHYATDLKFTLSTANPLLRIVRRFIFLISELFRNSSQLSTSFQSQRKFRALIGWSGERSTWYVRLWVERPRQPVPGFPYF